MGGARSRTLHGLRPVLCRCHALVLRLVRLLGPFRRTSAPLHHGTPSPRIVPPAACCCRVVAPAAPSPVLSPCGLLSTSLPEPDRLAMCLGSCLRSPLFAATISLGPSLVGAPPLPQAEPEHVSWSPYPWGSTAALRTKTPQLSRRGSPVAAPPVADMQNVHITRVYTDHWRMRALFRDDDKVFFFGPSWLLTQAPAALLWSRG